MDTTETMKMYRKVESLRQPILEKIRQLSPICDWDDGTVAGDELFGVVWAWIEENTSDITFKDSPPKGL